MDINFHYAAIKVLAHYAGFPLRDAQTIAYASQYVDDAAAHEEMELDGDPGVQDVRYEDGVFDPICTAHKDLDYVRSLVAVRGRLDVFVCFHFIPSLRGSRSEAPFKRVARNGSLAKRLVRDRLGDLRAAVTKAERDRALIGLGVALHSYADTWAHQGFSGYWDSDNNDISNLEKRGPRGQWRGVGLARWFFSYAAPDIGHAEAGTLPDRSDVAWKCKPRKRTTAVRESNCNEFLHAAETILGLLSTATEDGGKWTKIKWGLRRCFMSPAEAGDFEPRKTHVWSTEFKGHQFDYDHRAWFDDAMCPKGGFSDLMGNARGLLPETFELGSGREYFYFHAAAKLQRKAVRKTIIDAAG